MSNQAVDRPAICHVTHRIMPCQHDPLCAPARLTIGRQRVAIHRERREIKERSAIRQNGAAWESATPRAPDAGPAATRTQGPLGEPPPAGPTCASAPRLGVRQESDDLSTLCSEGEPRNSGTGRSDLHGMARRSFRERARDVRRPTPHPGLPPGRVPYGVASRRAPKRHPASTTLTGRHRLTSGSAPGRTVRSHQADISAPPGTRPVDARRRRWPSAADKGKSGGRPGQPASRPGGPPERPPGSGARRPSRTTWRLRSHCWAPA